MAVSLVGLLWALWAWEFAQVCVDGKCLCQEGHCGTTTGTCSLTVLLSVGQACLVEKWLWSTDAAEVDSYNEPLTPEGVKEATGEATHAGILGFSR